MTDPPPPFPVTTVAERQSLPPRPWIVWAYLVTSLVGIVYGVAFSIARDGFSFLGTVWDLGISAIAVLVIWNASRVGWSVFAALGILFVPFVLAFLDRGMWGQGVVAIQFVTLAILFSPWMIRWIWRDARNAVE